MKYSAVFIIAIILAVIGIVAELVGVCHTDATTMVSGCVICILAIFAIAWDGYPK